MARSKTVPFVLCSCGKRGWEDEHDAYKALGRAKVKRTRNAPRAGTLRGVHRENRVYPCPESSLYHLTAMSRRHVRVVSSLQGEAA